MYNSSEYAQCLNHYLNPNGNRFTVIVFVYLDTGEFFFQKGNYKNISEEGKDFFVEIIKHEEYINQEYKEIFRTFFDYAKIKQKLTSCTNYHHTITFYCNDDFFSASIIKESINSFTVIFNEITSFTYETMLIEKKQTILEKGILGMFSVNLNTRKVVILRSPFTKEHIILDYEGLVDLFIKDYCKDSEREKYLNEFKLKNISNLRSPIIIFGKKTNIKIEYEIKDVLREKHAFIIIKDYEVENRKELIDKCQQIALNSAFQQIMMINLDKDTCVPINHETGEISSIFSFTKYKEKLTSKEYGDKERIGFLFEDDFIRSKLINDDSTFYFEFNNISKNGSDGLHKITLVRIPDPVDFVFLFLISNETKELSNKSKSIGSLAMDTLKSIFQIISIINFTSNTFQMVQNDLIPELKSVGYYDELITTIKNSLYDEYQSKFLERFNIKNIANCFDASKKGIYFEHLQKNIKGDYVWTCTKITFFRNYSTKNIFGVLLNNPIDSKANLLHDNYIVDYYKSDKNRLFISAISNMYKRLFEIDFKKDNIYEYKQDSCDVSVIDTGESLQKHVDYTVEHYIHPSNKKMFLEIMNYKNLKQCKEDGKTILYYNYLRKFSDEDDYVWCYVTIKLLDSEDDNLICFIYLQSLDQIHDNSDRQISELFEANRRADRANRAKTDFIARMSHDIRTPMNAIVGMTEIAKSNNNPNQTNYCLNKIEASADLLLRMLNDILDLTMIEEGTLSFNNHDISLPVSLSHLIDILYAQSAKKNQVLDVSIEKFTHDFITVDEVRLHQILFNIIGNSIKFTQNGGIIHFLVRELVTSRTGYSKYQFIISDNGIGMSKAFLEKIYFPFERENKDTINVYNGVGLGMSIVKNIVDIMGGKINVSSVLGKGSNFEVILEFPIAPEVSMKTERLSFVKVVIFDSNNSLGDAYPMLQSIGINPLLCDDTEDLLSIIATNRVDCIITDLVIPNSSALELAKRIYGIYGNKMPRVIIALYGEDIRYDNQTQIGIFGYIKKPIEKVNLFEKMGEVHDYIHIKMNNKSFNDKRLLLVEDIPINVEIAKESLVSLGAEITVATNGAEAINIVENTNDVFDLILMDIQMPIMNGFDATKAIRQKRNYQNIPIIAMTANVFKDDIQKALENGMTDYLCKPIKSKELCIVVKKYLM